MEHPVAVVQERSRYPGRQEKEMGSAAGTGIAVE